MRERKEAPKLLNGEHPDWFWLLSGGIDSVAAYLLTRLALHENYGKRPIMVYLDTRVGLPLNRLYVEQLADQYKESLWPLRTHEHFEDRVAGRGKYADRDDNGPPGAALHSDVQNELKGRQRGLLTRGFDAHIFVTGIRAEESDKRASFDKFEIDPKDHRYVKPVYELTKKECAEIILRADAPINPGWCMRHYTDCGCQANGDPSELDRIQELFPWFAKRMREIEEAAVGEGFKSMLGWDGLSAEEQRAREQGQRQMSLCGESCSLRTPTPIVRAFNSRVLGASIEKSVAILYGRD